MSRNSAQSESSFLFSVVPTLLSYSVFFSAFLFLFSFTHNTLESNLTSLLCLFLAFTCSPLLHHHHGSEEDRKRCLIHAIVRLLRCQSVTCMCCQWRRHVRPMHCYCFDDSRIFQCAS